MQVESHVFKFKTFFPVSLIKNYNQLFKLDKEDSSKFEVGLCQNSPFGYLFNIIGFYLGQIFNLNLLYQFYLMRLIPALFYLFFVFILEKNIINPPSKIFFLVFSSLPMILHQISAISLDSSIFIFLFYFYSLF